MNYNTSCITRKIGFYKEHGLWYADLPEFLEKQLGTKANLLMVDGSDRFLDLLSVNGNHVQVEISTTPFDGHTGSLEKLNLGLNQDLLDEAGHAPVDYGAYYNVNKFRSHPFHHRLWLCPVAEYVFEGAYPENIYIRTIE